MAELIANCPRCGAANMTFDVHETAVVGKNYNWQHLFETFSVCRNCNKATNFVLRQKKPDFSRHPNFAKPHDVKGATLNAHFEAPRFVSLIDEVQAKAPDHTPPNIEKVFTEAATCARLQCWNAVGAMLRLCIDLATKGLLPTGEVEGLNRNTRSKLAPRLAWLIDNDLVPEELRELSTCIREDGNDAAHDGTLSKDEAQDLMDFTVALFERLFTEPTRLKLAKERRDKRRASEETNGE